MSLWGCDLLQQWKTQINISLISETNEKLTHASEKDTKRSDQEQSPDLSEAPTALPLKGLTDKPAWVEQRPLTSGNLQAVEQLVQEQLNDQLKNRPVPWNSPVFSLKRNLENGDCKQI